MSILFLTFLAAGYCLITGRKPLALALAALMLAAMIAILFWEATTPLHLVF